MPSVDIRDQVISIVQEEGSGDVSVQEVVERIIKSQNCTDRVVRSVLRSLIEQGRLELGDDLKSVHAAVTA